jgi:hypothetical protein
LKGGEERGEGGRGKGARVRREGKVRDGRRGERSEERRREETGEERGEGRGDGKVIQFQTIKANRSAILSVKSRWPDRKLPGCFSLLVVECEKEDHPACKQVARRVKELLEEIEREEEEEEEERKRKRRRKRKKGKCKTREEK